MVEAWSGGALLAGSGGGAMVLCDPMVDPRGGAFTVGLGLVSGVTVIPGYETWSHEVVHRTRRMSPADLAIVGLPQATALVRDPDGSWSTAGVGEAHVFLGGEPAEVGDLAVGPVSSPR
jgi:cyanophycinase